MALFSQAQLHSLPHLVVLQHEGLLSMHWGTVATEEDLSVSFEVVILPVNYAIV